MTLKEGILTLIRPCMILIKLEIDLNKVQNDPNKPEFDPNMSISDRILYLIKNNPKISYKEMAEITGKSIPTIKRSINVF